MLESLCSIFTISERCVGPPVWFDYCNSRVYVKRVDDHSCIHITFTILLMYNIMCFCVITLLGNDTLVTRLCLHHGCIPIAFPILLIYDTMCFHAISFFSNGCGQVTWLRLFQGCIAVASAIPLMCPMNRLVEKWIFAVIFSSKESRSNGVRWDYLSGEQAEPLRAITVRITWFFCMW